MPGESLIRRGLPGDHAFGQSEIGELGHAVVADQDIGRLEIAVHHALLVCGGQGTAALHQVSRRLDGGHRRLVRAQALQGLAGDVLEFNEVVRSRLTDVVDGDDIGDARARRPRAPRTGTSRSPAAAGGQIRVQHFDGTRPVQHVVMGAKHPGHPAASQQRHRCGTARARVPTSCAARSKLRSIRRGGSRPAARSLPDRRSADPTRPSFPRRTAGNDPNRLPGNPDCSPGNNRCSRATGCPHKRAYCCGGGGGGSPSVMAHPAAWRPSSSSSGSSASAA